MFRSSLHSIFTLIPIVLAYCLSYLFNIAPFGYILCVRKTRLHKGTFVFCDCEYAKPGGTHVTIPRLEFAPQFPRQSFPCWGVLKAYNYEYADCDHHVTIGTVNVTLWLFPVLFRVTSGPWLTINLEDFRVRVHASKCAPNWVVQMRRKIFDTIFCGEIIRLDDFKLRTAISKPNPAARVEGDDACEDEEGGEEEEDLHPDGYIQLEPASAEGVVDGYATGWHMVNSKQRMFVFNDVVAQLRRDVDGDSGSYRMSTKDCSWIKVPPVGKQELNICRLVSWKMLPAVAQLPLDLYRISCDPLSAVDIIVSSCDVTFDRFRIRDAELWMHMERMLKSKYIFYSHQMKVDEMLADMFIAAVGTVVC